MKVVRSLLCFNLVCLGLGLTSCYNHTDCCDDPNVGCHMARGTRTLGGKHGDSRQIENRDEFMYYAHDYIPLEDEKLTRELAMSNAAIQQAEQSPGDPGSSVPGIDYFRDPMTIPGLAELFKNLYFPYNSDLIKGQENLQIAREIATYLKKHKNTYIFVEGHCDERGAEAYNLALGARRSNSVRNLLVNEGVNPSQIFTISYGKERPLVFGHGEESWKQNRRAEFKIYQR